MIRNEKALVYRFLARMKTADAILQALCFTTMLCTFWYDFENAGGAGLLLMAGIQCLSVLFWLFMLRRDTARMRGGMVIRRIFLVLVALILLAAVSGGQELWYAMIFTGPAWGFSYFGITIAEIRFYHKLAAGQGKTEQGI